jgi:hypothetical protein
LHAFLSNNANAYIGSLNHTYIIAAVANAADTLVRLSFDEIRYLCFLCGRATTRYDRGKIHGYLHEFVFIMIKENLALDQIVKEIPEEILHQSEDMHRVCS